MDFYEKNAEEYMESTKNVDMSSAYEHFCKHLKTGDIVLDVGCGSGRDLKYFLEKGFQAEGIEPSKAIYHILKKQKDLVVYPVTIQKFVPTKKYQAVWACASLLHLSKKEIIEFFSRIEDILFPDGVIYVSGKRGIETGYGKDGRFFLEFTEELLQEILNCNPHLELVETWDSEDGKGRTEIRWMNFIIRYKK